MALLALAVSTPAMSAQVLISVDKASQRMTVSVDGEVRYTWPVSTGMAGYLTPAGSFKPLRLAKTHYSKEWDDAPMPHSIFFTEAGHAVHGSSATGRLGAPASHGCVRLKRTHAATLFELVQAEGLENARIEVAGEESIGTLLTDASAGARDYGRLTSFDPLAEGIMVESRGARRRN
jgi:hypothetical protein